jgi:23S rRNA (pseudouridine1915-N3)-methyltransferase
MIKILCIGKTKHTFYEDAEEFYVKRIQRFQKMEYSVLDAVKVKPSYSPEEVKKLEQERIFKHIKPTDYVILLDEKGKDVSSRDFAKSLERFQVQGAHVVFVIGGAFGFGRELQSRANEKKALGKGTMSHELIRTVFLEQLYRAYSILHGHPYHND